MRIEFIRTTLAALFIPAALAAMPARGADGDPIQRGRYLVKVAGCNDCHTAGYAISGGKVPNRNGSWATSWVGAVHGEPPTPSISVFT